MRGNARGVETPSAEGRGRGRHMKAEGGGRRLRGAGIAAERRTLALMGRRSCPLSDDVLPQAGRYRRSTSHDPAAAREASLDPATSLNISIHRGEILETRPDGLIRGTAQRRPAAAHRSSAKRWSTRAESAGDRPLAWGEGAPIPAAPRVDAHCTCCDWVCHIHSRSTLRSQETAPHVCLYSVPCGL